MKQQSFLKGAAVISVGGIVAKILGALYRVPLTNLLGGEGMGLYQMVFPLYCLLLTVSATGIPSGLARLVSRAEARGENSRAILRRSLLLFSAIGLAGCAAMFLLARPMSAAQGEAAVAAAYRMLAPSVLLVSVLSCFRGWFQGRNNFVPTAVSEIAEQLVKIAFGLFFAYMYRENIVRAVEYSLLAVTISELAACLCMFALLPHARRPLYPERGSENAASLLRATLPVALAAGVLPLSNILDSILIVRLVSKYAENATALYGLYSGGASTLINLPVSVCYGLAAASVPAVAALYARGERSAAERKICFAVKCTLFLALPAAVFLFLFPSQVSSFIFRSLPEAEGAELSSLVRALAFAAVLLSAVQTLSACLTGQGRAKTAAISMAIGVAIKLGLEFVLLRVPQISVRGAAYAALACYLFALIFNLLYSIRERKNRLRLYGDALKFALISAGAMAAAYPLRAHILFAGMVAAAVYLLGALAFGAFSAEELQLPRRKKYVNDRRTGL